MDITDSIQIRKFESSIESYRMFTILDGIKKGLTRQTLCKQLNIKNSTLSYHLAKMKHSRLIEQVYSYPSSFYNISSKGEQIREIIVQSVDMSQNDRNLYKRSTFRIHNVILAWEIESFGSFAFNEKLWKSMKGWHFQKFNIDDHAIHIQDTGLIKIYCPEIYTNDPPTALAQVYEKANKIANYLASRDNMKIKPMKVIREAHKELVGSEKIAEILGYQKVNKVWIDNSTGSKCLEESQSSNDLEALIQMPKFLDEKLVPVIEQLTEQITLHLAVMNEMKDTMKDIREGLKEMRNEIKH